jgi:hypothetical protein
MPVRGSVLVVIRAPVANPVAAWIGIAAYAPTEVELSRMTASPVSPSNLMG